PAPEREDEPTRAWGNGRRAGVRSRSRKRWEFESPRWPAKRAGHTVRDAAFRPLRSQIGHKPSLADEIGPHFFAVVGVEDPQRVAVLVRERVRQPEFAE